MANFPTTYRNLVVAKRLVVKGTADFSGAVNFTSATFTGDTTWGDEATDTHTITGILVLNGVPVEAPDGTEIMRYLTTGLRFLDDVKILLGDNDDASLEYVSLDDRVALGGKNLLVEQLLLAGSGPTTLTQADGKILEAAIADGTILARLAANETVSGTWTFSNPVSIADATAAGEAASKGQLDAAIQGVSWQESVLDKDLSAPPGSPGTGDRYIVASGGSGAWAGQDDNIAEWDGSQWVFTTVQEGFSAWVEDEDALYIVNNAVAWVKMGGVLDHGNLVGLGDDDHSQYVHNTIARTISAVHTFDPGSATAPFILHANAQNQAISGLTATGIILEDDFDFGNRKILVGGALTGPSLQSSRRLDGPNAALTIDEDFITSSVPSFLTTSESTGGQAPTAGSGTNGFGALEFSTGATANNASVARTGRTFGTDPVDGLILEFYLDGAPSTTSVRIRLGLGGTWTGYTTNGSGAIVQVHSEDNAAWTLAVRDGVVDRTDTATSSPAASQVVRIQAEDPTGGGEGDVDIVLYINDTEEARITDASNVNAGGGGQVGMFIETTTTADKTMEVDYLYSWLAREGAAIGGGGGGGGGGSGLPLI